MKEILSQIEMEQISKLTEDFWRNVPIVDATEILILFPKRIDLEKAQSGDPENCVYARCIKRVWPKSRRVRIWREYAYVESKDAKGETIALRYRISLSGQKALKNFDLGLGEIKPCTLLPPSPSKSLAVVREKDQVYRKKYQQRLAEIARNKKVGIHKPNRQIPPPDHYLIRNGSGHHHSPVLP